MIGEEAQIGGAISIERCVDFFQRAAREQRKVVVEVETRREHGARITLATWPEDALKVLREARDAYLASLEGPKSPNERTDAQRDFSTILNAWMRHSASVGAANRFDPGTFPATTGLAAGETCALAR